VKGKTPALALIFHGKGGGMPAPDSKDDMGKDESSSSDELDPEFLAKFKAYAKIEDEPDADVEECAQAFWDAVKACVKSEDY